MRGRLKKRKKRLQSTEKTYLRAALDLKVWKSHALYERWTTQIKDLQAGKISTLQCPNKDAHPMRILESDRRQRCEI